MAGDPTKADRGTVAIIEVEGLNEPLRSVTQFSVSDDALQVGDTFSAVVPDPTHKLLPKIQQFAGYKFYLQNPNIDGGVPCLRQTGVIQGRELTASTTGDVINLRGADLGWHLQSYAEPFYRLELATIRDLLNQLLGENTAWGFKGVKDSNDLNRKLRQGRQAELIRLNPSFITPYKVIQIQPGQQIIQVLQEYARRDGLFVGVTADGYITLWNPNYEQPTSFQVNYHPAGTPEARSNNIVGESTVIEDGSMLYTHVSVVWDEIIPGIGHAPYTANIGRHVATYTRSTNSTSDVRADYGGVLSTGAKAALQTSGPKFPRRYVFTDSEPMTAEQGARRAVYQAQRMEWDAFIYRCKLAGHSQNGKWISSDTLGAVNDSVRGVKGTLYAPTVRLDGSKLGANTTYLELRTPGLLSNKPLVLNQVENKGGIYVEVQAP